MADIEEAAAAAFRGRAARVTWALHRFLTVGSHGALVALLAVFFLCSVGNAFRLATLWAFGARSPFAALGKAYFDSAILAVLLVGTVDLAFVLALCVHCLVVARLLRRDEEKGEAREVISAERAATIPMLAAALEHDAAGIEADDPVAACGAVTMILLLMGMGLGQLAATLAPAAGSWQGWVGSVLFNGCFFFASLTFSYVV